ncbi:TM2 domain containing protein [Tieghemostelium lacteum]|uniref:TM2 domain containing protein n=1 Tax=Tieghemostelium lacteum TaxID=361077 RepID=A0A151ZA64_TIELA|nr:TM2 domain containing protein [Tieghemostelium lacteum]|eukprot:KYQ90839.1 TM2 domain containing protein [Tieghemostelium lacteum]
MKSMGVAYLLWFFFGLFGIHRFYLNRTCSGVIYLFTLGIFFIGFCVDLCLIPGMVESENAKLRQMSSGPGVVVNTTVVQPVYQPPPPQGYPQQGGYPPQQGGYPPQDPQYQPQPYQPQPYQQ